MPALMTYDVLLVGYRNDLARMRTLQHLDGNADDARNERLPRLLYSGLDAGSAENMRRELARLGAQVSVVPVGTLDAPTLSAPPPRRSEVAPLRVFNLVVLVIFGMGAIMLFTRGVRLQQQRPQKALPPLQVNRPQRDAPDAALAAPPPQAVAIKEDALLVDDPQAVQLNNDAIALARRQEFEGAVRQLRAALAVAPGSATLTRNLQAVLVSWGVAALDAGDLSSALNRLQAAVALGDQVEALYGLGVVHLRLQDAPQARQVLERALALDPHDGRILMALGELYLKEDQRADGLALLQRARDAGVHSADLERRIDQLGREVDAEWDFVEHTSAHFRISFADDEDYASVQTVLQAMEDAYDEVSSKLGHYLDERVAVVLYTQRDFHDITRTPDWAGGAFDGRIKLPVRGLAGNDDAELSRVARHELAHAFVHDLTRGRCPVWLNEGVAVWAEESEDGERLSWAAQRMDGHRPFGFAQLSGSFTSLNARDAEAAYAQSYLAVRQLIERNGPRSVKDLLQALRSQSLEAAFNTALRDNFALFEDRFMRDNGGA